MKRMACDKSRWKAANQSKDLKDKKKNIFSIKSYLLRDNVGKYNTAGHNTD
jgi:hypothetical protein